MNALRSALSGLLILVCLIACGEDAPKKTLQGGNSDASTIAAETPDDDSANTKVEPSEESSRASEGETKPSADEADPAEEESNSESQPEVEESAEVSDAEEEDPLKEPTFEALDPIFRDTTVVVQDAEGQAIPNAVLSRRKFEFGGAAITVFGERAETAEDSLRANDKGEVELKKLPEGSHYFLYENDAMLGALRIDIRPDQELGKRNVVLVQPHRMLEISVKDEKQSPVEGAILLLLDPKSERRVIGFSSEFDGWQFDSTTTGPDGVARVYLRTEDQDRSIGRAETLRVTALRYGGKSITKDFPFGEESAFAMEIPETVSLKVDIETPRGEPLVGLTDLFWTWGRGEPLRENDGDPLNRLLSSGLRGPNFDGEKLLVDQVDALTWNWRVEVGPEGRTISAFAPGSEITTTLRAPRRMNRKKRFRLRSMTEQKRTLESGSRKCRVLVRLRPRKTETPPSSELRFELAVGGGRVQDIRFSEPNDKGIREAWLEPRQTGVMHVRHRTGFGRFSGGGSSPSLARFEVQGLEAGATLDLGEKKVDRLPVIASGVVRDFDGQPASGVFLSGIEQNSDGKRLSFQEARRFTDMSDEEGRFEFRAEPKPNRKIEITVSGEYFAEPRVVDHKSVDVNVEVGKTGRIEGRIAECPNAIRDVVRITCQASDDPKIAPYVRIQRDGEFKIRSLKPGKYDITVFVGDVIVLRKEKLLVKPGETALPTELAKIPVAKDFEVGRVTIKGPGGFQVKNASVLLIPENKKSGGGVTANTNDEGLAQLVLRKGEKVGVFVSAKGRHGPDLYALVSHYAADAKFPLELELAASTLVNVDLSLPLPNHPRGNWQVSLTRPRSADEIRIEKRRRTQALAVDFRRFGEFNFLQLDSRGRLKHLDAATEKLPPGVTDVNFEVGHRGTFKLVLRRPGDRLWKDVIELGEIEIGDETEVEYEAKVSASKIQEIRKKLL